MSIWADQPVTYYRLRVSSPVAGGVTLNLYAKSSDIRFNLQPIVKGLMPFGSNFTMIRIYINPDNKLDFGLEVAKMVIRGGRRVTNSIFNQTIAPTDSLRISEKLPAWDGYDYKDYELDNRYFINEVPKSKIRDIDYRRKKGCNNIYVTFLNQNGGYSSWLFESHERKESSSNLGSFLDSNSNQVLDLGQEIKSEMQLFSKIPQEYKAYILDLIVSSDVSIYNAYTGHYEKVFLKSNSFDFDNIKKVYNVSINLELKYRFNPSLIW
jgi:hypothetical protein